MINILNSKIKSTHHKANVVKIMTLLESARIIIELIKLLLEMGREAASMIGKVAVSGMIT
jgi:hypothetical protein